MVEVVSLDALDGAPHAVAFPGSEPRTIRLTLDAGESVPPHTHPDRRIVLHLLGGELELRVGEESVTATAGDVVRFDGDREISPRAREDATALLVLAPRADGGDG